MKDTKLNNWKEFIAYQSQRGVSSELIQLLKDIYAHLKIQYRITLEQVNLRNEKMTFQVANKDQLGKLFLNVHIKKKFLRLLLLNDGVIPAIATKVEGVKGYPNLHKIELTQSADFTTEVRMAILSAYKVVSGVSIFNNNTIVTVLKSTDKNSKSGNDSEVIKIGKELLEKQVIKLNNKQSLDTQQPITTSSRTMINSANNYAISDLLNNEKQIIYYIPKYQREYVWTKWNWESLFDDLIENDIGHFLGSIICINKKKDSLDQDMLELVDGQQRMTTLSLLFVALYKYLSKFKTEEDEDLLNDIINLKYRIILKSDKKTIRLQPSISGHNKQDYEHILGHELSLLKEVEWSKSAGRRRFVKAFRYFYSRLEEINKDGEPVFGLEGAKLLLKKVNSAILVKIEVSSHSDAFTLFETLNNRGVPLSPMDLIKNSFLNELEKLKQGTIDDNFSKWNKLIQNLTDDTKVQERFLRHFYNVFKEEREIGIHRKNKALRSNLISIYDTLIKRNTEIFFDRLFNSSKIYYSLITPDAEENEPIVQKSLKDLENIGGAPGYALLLFVWEKYELTNQEKNELIDFIVKYFVRRNVTDTPPTRDLDNIFIELTKQLSHKKKYDFAFITSFLRHPSRFASDELFKAKLGGKLYYDNKGAARFILCKLEESHFKTKENYINFWARDHKNKYIWTIEHIFPQGKNIPQHWVEMVAEGDINKAQELQEQYVHTLGNLTLTGYNSNLSNMSFANKRDKRDKKDNFVGFRNGLFLNETIKAKEEWTATDIQARGKYLIELVMDLFK